MSAPPPAPDPAGAPATPDIERPTTTTRDPAALRVRLEQWMLDHLGAGCGAHVRDVEPPSTNGMSSETLLFDATWKGEGGEVHDERLVARVAPDPSAVPVFERYDLGRQFETMRTVAAHAAIPVPKVYWWEPDGDAIGAPFFVMERIDGVVPPDIMPYTFGDNWLFDASRSDQRRLQDATVNVLAQLHGIPDAEHVFAFLASDAPGATPLARHVREQRAFYEWVVAQDGVCSPLLERCFSWLDDHWPAHESPVALSWGDARIGNILYREFEPAAVLDWEMAALAPPEVDLAWCIFLHRFFEDLATTYGFAGMPHFLRRDDVAAAYEAMTGHAPRDLDWYTMYAATRHGVIMFRIHRRSVQFGEAVTPDDPDDMITHRATLEAMLEGRYWSGLAQA